MKRIFAFLLIIFTLTNLSSQSSWINYSNDHIIRDIAFEEDSLWVATQGGLVKIDMETGDKEVFQAWNSGFRGPLFAQHILIKRKISLGFTSRSALFPCL